jgi:transposase-like protein
VDQKLAIIGEAFASGSSVASTIERHEMSSGQLYTWQRGNVSASYSHRPGEETKYQLLAVSKL